eukprot:GILJ01007247.1.p1 GENE.GILJ01007247.1~~GILJ01007247.1.p1  ORF type:complete len:881 (-),score=84.03 GILJ01007247.1:123-2765(-)
MEIKISGPSPNQFLSIWGYGRWGRLGLGDEKTYQYPHPLKMHSSNAHGSASSTSTASTAGLSPCNAAGTGDAPSGSGGISPTRTVYKSAFVSVDVNAPDASCDDNGYLHIACGENHTAVVTGHKRLLTFGKNVYGQLGHGNEYPCFTPLLVTTVDGKSIVSTSCGTEHMAALSRDGEVYTWGLGFRGQLGHGNCENRLTPESVQALLPLDKLPFVPPGNKSSPNAKPPSKISLLKVRERVDSVACGGLHTVAVTNSGRVFSWGFGYEYQLGHGDNYNSLLPREIECLRDFNIKQVACGTTHTAALAEDGRVFVWGNCGTAEDVDTISHVAPAPIEELAERGEFAVSVKCGEAFTAILTEQGEVWTWGSGAYGKLGHGDTTPRRSPCLVEALLSVGKVTQIDCGFHHMMVSIEGGREVYTWGSNQYGQLGLGPSVIISPTPKPIPSLSNCRVALLVCGGYHSACISLKKPTYEEHCNTPSPPLRKRQVSSSSMVRELSKRKLGSPKLSRGSFDPPDSPIRLPVNASIDKLAEEHLPPLPPPLNDAEKEMEGLRKEIERLQKEAQQLRLSRDSYHAEPADEQIEEPPQEDEKDDGGMNSNMVQKSLEDPRRYICDNYEVEYEEIEFGAELGEGMYGRVFKGLWRGTPVAAKKMKFAIMDDRLMEDFKSELAVMKPLRHPNIVLFMGACTKGTDICILTELFARGSLWDVLQKRSINLPWDIRIKMAREGARGMTYLHLAKPYPILHRDLKSLNLLVTDDFGVKVCDFGWAKLKSSTTSGNVDTFQWMAPEVITSKSYTVKADVYSFGIILWEIATRQPPYHGKLHLQVIRDVVQRQKRLAIPGNCPKPFADLIRSCWDQDPDRRPEFTEVLQRLETMPIPHG